VELAKVVSVCKSGVLTIFQAPEGVEVFRALAHWTMAPYGAIPLEGSPKRLVEPSR
jgi:hypothetical protein